MTKAHAFVVGATLLLVSPAHADPAVRVGGHDGFGRVVWEFAHDTDFTAERSGNTVTLHFTDPADVPAGSSATRNVTAVTGGPGTATVTLVPGARLRTVRLGNRVVLDAMDPARPKHAKSPNMAAPPPVPANVPRPMVAQAAEPPVAQAAPVLPVIVVPSTPAPVAPIVATAEPPPASPPATAPAPAAAAARTLPASLALAATSSPLPPGVVGSAVLLPFDGRTGAAAFRRGGAAWLVFDQPRPLDLAAIMAKPAFAGAAVQALPQATVLRIPIADGAGVTLQRQASGWAVIIAAGQPAAPPVTPAVADGQLQLHAPNPGSVVAVPDAETGGNLLVGTLRGEAAGLPVGYTAPGFTLLPTWQGVAVEPLSDRVVLHDAPDGFVIETGSPLSAAPDGARALADAAFLTRRYDFPTGPTATLLRQLQAQVADAGAAPAQSRLQPRRAAAQTMIALGLGAEAQSLLQLAVAEDPRAATDPDLAGLTAIAALLAGRPAEASRLADPALTGTDEIALWRAVCAAQLAEAAPDAAAAFAATAKLVLAYPDALRTRLLPLVAETMAQGGAGPAADALLAQRPDDEGLAYARALRQEAKGDSAGALAAYDTLARQRDQLVSTRAATRATLLRLSTGAIEPIEAAVALERSFMDWRGDARERDLRLRAAGLRAQAGQWRAALALLRETEPLYPDDAALIHARMAATMNDLLTGPAAASIAPMDMVALADENAELAARTAPAATAALLADKLTALDLPRRAVPILDRMLRASAPGPAQAAIGEKLAALRLADADATGALAALALSAAPGLPPALAEQRGLLSARAAAQTGDIAGAVATLAKLGTAAADDLRAAVLTDAKDWHGAQAALADLMVKTIPATGPLSPVQQDTVLRLASAQSHNGDAAAMRDLAQAADTRLEGPRADMFRLLTAIPVTGVADLRRAGGEVALARAVPAALAAIGSH